MTILTATPGLPGNIYRDQGPRGRMRQQHFIVAPGVAYDVTARHLGAHAWRVTVRYQEANLTTTTLPSNYPTTISHSNRINKYPKTDPIQQQSTNMPLVVPGLQSKGGDDKSSEWMNKLAGKKIGESSNETVRTRPCLSVKNSS